MVSQTRRKHATNEQLSAFKRQGGCSTGFSVRGFRCFHTLRSEDHQSSPLHCLLASARRVLAGEGNSRLLQLSSLALLLAGLPGGLSDAESGACDASGPLPTENRKVGYTMAYSLAPCLSSGRQEQVRTLQPAEIADRVRHHSRPARSADVGCGVSLVSHFLEGSGGRRDLLGRQHSAPSDELAGTWKQVCRQGSRASGCGGHARWWCGGACSGNFGSSWSSVHVGSRHFRQSEGAPEQEGMVNGTTKRGEERSRDSAGKETERQGRRQGRKEQRGTPYCRPRRDAIVFQLEFWWWDVWRAFGGKPAPSGQSSQMYNVPVRQTPGKTVPTVLTRPREGRDQDSRAGDQEQDSCPSLSSCAGRRILDISALLFGASRVRTGRGYFGSRRSSRYQGQDHQPGYPPRRHRFAGRRTFHDRSSGCLGRTVRRISFRLPVFLLQSCQVSSGWPATSEGPPAYAWTSVEQSCTTARSGERDFARHAIGSYRTRHPVWIKETATAMHCDARESSGPGCRPVPECLVVACVSRHRHRARRQVCNSQYLLFWPSSLDGAMLDRFSSRSRDIREKVLLQSPTCATVDQNSHSIRSFVPATALRGIRHVMAERHDKPQRAFNHTHHEHIYGSRWVECASIKRVSVSANHVQETRQRNGKRVSRWWFTTADPILVHGAWLGGDWTQALGLHRRSALQRHKCVHAHPFVWSSRFPGSTVGVGRENPKRNLEGVRPGTSRNDSSHPSGCPALSVQISCVV